MLKKWFVWAVSLSLAEYFIPGFDINGGLGQLVLVSLLFLLINSIVKPVIKFVTLPLNLLTMGLFSLVVNAFCLWFLSYVSQYVNILAFDLQDINITILQIQSFQLSFLGSLLVSSLLIYLIHHLIEKIVK